jgi:hypothetical protein
MISAAYVSRIRRQPMGKDEKPGNEERSNENIKTLFS